jgi:hypothetical protein
VRQCAAVKLERRAELQCRKAEALQQQERERVADFMEQFHEGTYADDPLPTENVLRRF